MGLNGLTTTISFTFYIVYNQTTLPLQQLLILLTAVVVSSFHYHSRQPFDRQKTCHLSPLKQNNKHQTSYGGYDMILVENININISMHFHDCFVSFLYYLQKC